MFSKSMMKLKEPLREKIRQDVETYLNTGGKIKPEKMGKTTGRFEGVSRTWNGDF